MRSSAGLWIGVAVLGAAALAVVVLTPEEGLPPFDAGSSEPDGYRGVSLLLEQAGVEVTAAEIGTDPGDPEALSAGAGEAVVVPVEDFLDEAARDVLDASARRGATVVVSGTDGFFAIPDSALTRTAAQPAPRGFCDIAELEDLESLDDIDGFRLDAGLDEEVCFDNGTGPLVKASDVGAGRVIELASPYLWANARLQPDKEDGGRALDNGPMAVALLGDASTVTFVVPTPPPDFAADGTRNPIELMPLPVKLALLQAVGAFVVYLLWKGRRLGQPVSEEMPVEVAGSELVEAVGGLLRRSAGVASAAGVLRSETRRELSRPLGVPVGAEPTALVAAVSGRTGRDHEAVRSLLYDGSVTTVEDLVALCRSLDELELEVLDVQHA